MPLSRSSVVASCSSCSRLLSWRLSFSSRSCSSSRSSLAIVSCCVLFCCSRSSSRRSSCVSVVSNILSPPAKSRRAYSKARPATSGGPLPAASGRPVEPEEQLDYTPDVLLEPPLVHGRRESDEQPEIGIALEQGEEVARRIHRLVDAQLPARAGLLEDQGHALAYPLRTGLVEQLGQLGILPGHPHQQAVQGQGLGTVDQRTEGQPDPLQGLPDIALRRYTTVEVGQLRLADQSDGSGVECLLVPEVVVDSELGYAGLGGDRIHAGALVAIAQKQLLRCLQHRGTLGGVLWTSGSGSGYFLVRHDLPILDW